MVNNRLKTTFQQHKSVTTSPFQDEFEVTAAFGRFNEIGIRHPGSTKQSTTLKLQARLSTGIFQVPLRLTRVLGVTGTSTESANHSKLALKKVM